MHGDCGPVFVLFLNPHWVKTIKRDHVPSLSMSIEEIISDLIHSLSFYNTIINDSKVISHIMSHWEIQHSDHKLTGDVILQKHIGMLQFWKTKLAARSVARVSQTPWLERGLRHQVTTIMTVFVQNLFIFIIKGL